MKVKRIGVFAALAVTLLVAAMLITTCMDPLSNESVFTPTQGGPGPVNIAGGEALNIPEGKAVIRISIDTDNFRSTVFPTLPELDTMYYDVELESVADSGNSDINENDYELGTAIVVDEDDTYNITLYAFSNAARTILVAKGETATAVTPVQDANTEVPIVLTPIGIAERDTANRTGTFAWNITLPINATTANLRFEGLTSAATTQANIDISTNNVSTTPITLNSGYYRVYAEFGATNFQSVSIPVIVHIYSGMPSTYTRIFPALNRNAFQVQFRNSDNSVINQTAAGNEIVTIPSLAHGNAVTRPAGTPTHPSVPGRTFDDWYTTEEGSGTDTEWIFSGDTGAMLVYRDRDIHARYLTATTLNITATWVAGAIDNRVITLSQATHTTTIEELEDGDIVEVVITITNNSAFTGGVRLLGPDGTTVVGDYEATAGTITFDVQDYEDFWYPQAIYTLEATITGAPNILYSGTFTVNITGITP